MDDVGTISVQFWILSGFIFGNLFRLVDLFFVIERGETTRNGLHGPFIYIGNMAGARGEQQRGKGECGPM